VAAAALVARGGNLILGGHAWKDFNSATIGSNVGNQVLWAAGLGIFISSISVKSGKRGDLPLGAEPPSRFTHASYALDALAGAADLTAKAQDIYASATVAYIC